MKKSKIWNLALVTLSVLLLIVALAIGFENGLTPLIITAIASASVAIALVMSLFSGACWQNICFRFMVLCFSWAGIFFNQRLDYGVTVTASLGFIFGAFLLVWVIYYGNTHITRDIEKDLK